MDKFKKFFMGLSVSERDEFARKCGTSRQHLTNIAYGIKTCGEGLAIQIDKATSGFILCEDMRPDIDWAYLRAKAA